MNSQFEAAESTKTVLPVAKTADSVARGQLLDDAYDEYLRRRIAGAVVDKAAFLDEFASIRSELARMIDADEYLDAHPELLIDAPTHWPRVGTTWEGFELLEELGRGAFARVYLARELALGGRTVAIKCACLGTREAATLGRLDHANVVPIHSIRDLPDRNMTIVCMPYLGHATLQQVSRDLHSQPQPTTRADAILHACRDPRLPGSSPPALLRRGSYLDGVRWIGQRVAAALAYLHSQSITHRDLKPSNILLQPDGTPRLLDFNLSADAKLPQARLGGTLHYMAPEQLEALEHGDGAGLTPMVDVFALGVILYEWLAGKHPCAPLPEDGSAKSLQPHLLRHYRQMSLAPLQEVEPALATLIEQCLRLDPEARPTAAEVERQLRRQLRPAPRIGRTIRRHPLRALAVSAALAAALALVVVQVSQQPSRSQAAMDQGWKAYRTGDFAGAMDRFNEGAAHGADVVDCLFARGRVFQRMGEQRNSEFFGDAMAEYRNAFERTSHAKYRAAMGYCAHRMQQLPAAKLIYEQAIEQGYDNAALYHNLGCLYLDVSNITEARKCFERALALDNSQGWTHCQLASLLVYKHWQLMRNNGESPEPGAAPPELIRLGLDHLERGLPDIKQAAAAQCEHVAGVYAMALDYDASCAAKALDWLERSVQAGAVTAQLKANVLFRPLHDDPRFLAIMSSTPPSRPPVAWVRILDPLSD